MTITKKCKDRGLNTTLQFGRLLPPLTISQEATTPTTGHQHQQARQARGTITFYNGQFQAITVPAGTLLSGSSGVQIATDQQADIPPGNPPMYGQATVSAHAISPGVKGNIAAYDISQVCCASAVLVKNTTPFFNGQDERNYTTVARHDIDKLSASLKTTLAQSVQGAFQGQLKNGEALVTPICKPTVTSDHLIGAEATQVKVTVSETCSSVAYSFYALQTKATALLTRLAIQTLGTGYSLIGTVTVSVIQAEVNRDIPTLTVSSQGTWVYAVNQQEQGKIQRLVEGRLKTDALHVLLSLPGVQGAHIDGMADSLRMPTDIEHIHIAVVVAFPASQVKILP